MLFIAASILIEKAFTKQQKFKELGTTAGGKDIALDLPDWLLKFPFMHQ